MNRTFFFPVNRYQLLNRPRIIEKALRGNPALILLHGGTGSGKQLAATQIAEQFAESGGAAVWVRFGSDDGDLTRFWNQILSTVTNAGVLTSEGAMTAAVQRDHAAQTASALAGLRKPLLLVLEVDLIQLTRVERNTIDESVLQTLELAPALTVIVNTRYPRPTLTSRSARLRVPIRMVGPRELMFSQGETCELVDLRLPHVPEKDRRLLARALHAESKGWPLGVHAIIVDQEDTVAPEVEVKRGTLARDLVDRLLTKSTPEEAAVLCMVAQFEEISAPVLAHSLNTSESEAEAHLEEIAAISFGHWVDEDGTKWYRHHELIRKELAPHAPQVIGVKQLQEMRSRAARGFREPRPRLAIEAALFAEDWQFLSQLLVNDLGFSLGRDRPRKWLKEIPKKVRDRYPVLATFALLDEYAFPAGRAMQVIAAMKVLASKTLAVESQKGGITGVVAAGLRMVVARLGGKETLAVELAQQLEENINDFSSTEYTHFRKIIEVGLTQAAITYIHAGRLTNADRMLTMVLEQQQFVHPTTEASINALAAWSAAWQGNMRQAREYASAGRNLDTPAGWRESYIGTGYRIAEAVDELERGNPEVAAEHLDALAEHDPTIEHWPFLTVLDILITESKFGPVEGLARLESHLSRRRNNFAQLPSNTLMLRTLKARLLWHSGRVVPRDMRLPDGHQINVYSALSQGENHIALALTSTALRDPATAGLPRLRAEMRLLKAKACYRTGDIDQALESADIAAKLMRDHSLTLPMRVAPLDWIESLAELAPDLPTENRVLGQARAIRPLTRAELRALRAVVEHGSVPLAAKALYLSNDTIKTHMKNVYRKLGAKNRAEAIRVAGRAGLF